MAKKSRKKEIAKLIHLPKETIVKLDDLAIRERTHTKPYMEKVLIDHAKKEK